MLNANPFVNTVSKQAKSRSHRQPRHFLETLEIRTLLSSDMVFPGWGGTPNTNNISVAYVMSAVPTAGADNANDVVRISAAAAPAVVYNANDWAKYTDAVTKNGLTAAMVTWTEVDGEMRITSINANNSNLKGILDLSGCTALKELSCDRNKLTALNVSGCSALQSLSCGENLLTSLNVTGCKALQILYCDNNKLTALDVSSCTVLKMLYCPLNKMKSLNAAGCTALQTIDCYANQLTSLNVTGCTALQSLDCSINKLTALSVSGCIALQMLDCNNNKLTSLNVSGCIALKTLSCNTNSFTSLNVSGCTALQKLDCSFNKLTSLNITGCAALQQLYCISNKLTSLDLSNYTTLSWLYCSNNQLTSLNVSGCTALYYIDCTKNKLTSLNTSDCPALNNTSIKCDAPAKANGTKSATTLSTITLTWKAIANNADYVITCTSHPGLRIEYITDGTTVTIKGLDPATTYTFSIVARGFNGTKALAVTVNAKTQAYTAVTKLKATPSQKSVTLTWEASKFPETTTYEIFRLDGATETPVWSGDSTTATIPNLTASTKYTFIIRAISNSGSSAPAKITTSTTK